MIVPLRLTQMPAVGLVTISRLVAESLAVFKRNAKISVLHFALSNTDIQVLLTFGLRSLHHRVGIGSECLILLHSKENKKMIETMSQFINYLPDKHTPFFKAK
jgi:hypothetical protein